MKVKHTFTLACLFIAALTVSGQNLHRGKDGKTKFFSAALLENIEAESNMVSSLFNEATGEVAVLIKINSFVFKKRLMQEHFNENYMESDKYPDASFTGKVEGMQSLKDVKSQIVDIAGSLIIHGVSKPRTLKVTLSVDANGAITAKGSFNVKLEDHKIKVPSLLFQNIAETVDVSFELVLK